MTNLPATMLVCASGERAGLFPALANDILRQLAHLRSVVPTRALDAAVIYDPPFDPTVRQVLDRAGRHPPEFLSETNSGDPATYTDFARWARERCRGDSLIIVLSGHGLGWQDGRALAAIMARGIPGGSASAARTRAMLPDRTPAGPDLLTNAEITGLMRDMAAIWGKKPACLVFDGCNMSCIEVAHELRRVVGATVAALDQLSSGGLDLAGAAHAISSLPDDASDADFASSFARSYTPAHPCDTCVALDLASPHFTQGVAEFADFTEDLLAWSAANRAEDDRLRRAISSASELMRRSTAFSFADLETLRACLAAIHGLPIDRLSQCVQTLRRAVIHARMGPAYATSLGLSIYAPASPADFAATRDDYQALEFAESNRWFQLLQRLFDPTEVAPAGRTRAAAHRS